MVRHRVLIDSVDRTLVTLEDGYEIRHATGGITNLISLTLDDPLNAITVALGKDLIIEDWDTASIKYFGGIIVDIDYEPEGLGRRITVTANDWKVLVQRNSITKSYFDKTDQFIIQDMFTQAGLTEINTSTFVELGPVIPRLDFHATSLMAAMEQISDITGWPWDVDVDKNLIYREFILESATVAFSDSPDYVATFGMIDPRRSVSLGSFNAVDVMGIERQSDDVQDEYGADGNQTVFYLGVSESGKEILTRPPVLDFAGAAYDQPLILIQRNTGSQGAPTWVDQVVRLDGQNTFGDGSGVQILWSPAFSRIEWGTAPSNIGTNSFRVRGKFFGPIRVVVKDPRAIAFNNGREFRYTLVERNIKDRIVAEDIGMAFLRNQGNQDIVSFEFDANGLKPAQVVSILSTKLGIAEPDNLYFVTEMVTFVRGGTVIGYQGTFSSRPVLG